MADVGGKRDTRRVAMASGQLRAAPETLRLLKAGRTSKGDAFTVAKVAGILAAKRTSELIPLCHDLLLDAVDLKFEVGRRGIRVEATAAAQDRTGVEMEALTAVAVACLTLYDMAKSVERGMEIASIRLERKSGGRSGTYVRRKS